MGCAASFLCCQHIFLDGGERMAQRNFLAPHWSVTPIARILGPMQQFINRSASSGIVLLIATVAALVIANSGLAPAYNELLHTEIGITVGPFELREDLLHWINDGLMA